MILALKRSEKHLTTLKLRSINDLLVSPRIDESTVTLQFPSLQHLDINTSTTRQDMRQPAEVSFWVKILYSLKTFCITQHPRASDEPDMIKLLSKVHFASLAGIYIKYARTPLVPLASFIARHFDTLNVISITHPAMSAESWVLFRSGFINDNGKIHQDKKILLSEGPYCHY